MDTITVKYQRSQRSAMAAACNGSSWYRDVQSVVTVPPLRGVLMSLATPEADGSVVVELRDPDTGDWIAFDSLLGQEDLIRQLDKRWRKDFFPAEQLQAFLDWARVHDHGIAEGLNRGYEMHDRLCDLVEGELIDRFLHRLGLECLPGMMLTATKRSSPTNHALEVERKIMSALTGEKLWLGPLAEGDDKWLLLYQAPISRVEFQNPGGSPLKATAVPVIAETPVGSVTVFVKAE